MLTARVFDYHDRTAPENHSPFLEFLRLRKRVFVDDAGWRLTATQGLEVDQYDNPASTYVLIEDDGDLIAGARITAGDQPMDGWTNLLQDAAQGRIAGIPPEIFPPNFQFAGVYECGRLVVDRARVDQETASQAFCAMGRAFAEFAASRGAAGFISLSPPVLRRKFRAMGFGVHAIGSRYVCPDDGLAYQILHLDTSVPAAVQRAA